MHMTVTKINNERMLNRQEEAASATVKGSLIVVVDKTN
jgi:hypothetical protein